ncbi:MAG: hypothetical protein JWR19_2486 [Pedosphaera sp.]|nr:hypothetical protein [Pedosphaera sp.]
MSKNNKLKREVTQSAMRRLAGGASYARGESYFANGNVVSLVEHADSITAKVIGTEEYEVTLMAREGGLDYECSCPMGADGVFCKHCVAVGLAWLANLTGGPKATTTPVVTLDDARAWLSKQEKGTLIELVMEQAAKDEHLRERLLLQSAKSAGPGVDVAAIRKAIYRATNTRGFVDYRAARDFARGIDQVVDSIAELLEERRATEVIELSEHALARVEAAISQMDDSDGNIGGILGRLQELHLAACREAKPYPEKLAARLFDWEMRTPWDTFYGAAGTYADVLGERGLATYGRLAEAAWARVPTVGPGGKDPEVFGKSYRIKQIMEAIARQSGDIEALVAIKARDLSSAYHFLEIAEIYREAKQPDDALAWAERGIKAFPKEPDSRLREFLADEYHRRRRHDAAMDLIWAEFSEGAYLQNYQKLKQHADRIRQWPGWREKALDLIRAEIEQQKQGVPKKPETRWRWRPPNPDHSELVRIFLWEGDVETAWQEAKTGDCNNSLWLELAAKREKEFPADVIPIYKREIESLINQTNNTSYAEAVKLLGRIRQLMARLQQSEQFASFLTALRATYKAKRNFIKLVERL